MEAVKKKEEGYRFDAELDGRINNPASFTHNKFLDVPFNREMGKDVRPMDARPPGVAERIFNDFKLHSKQVADAIDTLKKEHIQLSGAEADFFKEVIAELKTIRKKDLEGKALVSDRLEPMSEEDRAFWAKGDPTIIADPVAYTRIRFHNFAHVTLPDGEAFVSADTLPHRTAETIAGQYRGEKLPKAAELLEKEAERTTDKKEKHYFLEVAKELRITYEHY
jgi:hypothetical protein